MNRQQWAILLTGLGAILVLSVALIGGSVETECSGSECGHVFGEAILKGMLMMMSGSLGMIFLLIGIILFITDASERRKVAETESIQGDGVEATGPTEDDR